MTREGESGRREAVHGVAAFTFVRIRRQELTGMNVFVTIAAGCGFRVIVDGSIFYSVTLPTGHSGVFA
jgi:hypothetical protein